MRAMEFRRVAQKLPVKSRKKKKQREERRVGRPALKRGLRPLDSAYPSAEEGVDGRGGTGGVRGRQGARFDPSGPHVGQELVRDFGENFLSEACHAEDVVPPPVDVVSEGDEL